MADKDTSDCSLCNSLTPEQRIQLATPSYKIKKEKREAKRAESTNPTTDDTLVDPSSVEVIGVVGDSQSSQVDSAPPEKKTKKDKLPSKSKKPVESSSTDSKISELDQKWSERFNRIESLLLSKSLQPSFTSEVRVSPAHTPPAGIRKDSELFLCQLTCQSADIMSSLCGVGVRVRVNNFFSKTTRPRDMLFFLKDTLSIEDEKLFKECKSVCSSVC